MRLVPLLTLSVLGATPLAAQLRPADSFGPGAATVAQHALYGAPDSAAAGATSRPSAGLARANPVRGALGLRLLTGALGAGAGIIVGGLAGYNFLPHGDCGDDPGLCETAMGAAVGAVAGAAFGAAIPAGTGACSFERRLGAGLLGASAGGLVGFLVGRPNGGLIVFTLPIAATIGGAVGADHC